MSVVVVGLSHRSARVEVREQVAVPLERAAALARELAAAGHEAICLSTCNRTELYLAGDDPAEAETLAYGALLALSAETAPEVGEATYRLRDEAAALHLFRVASGLDSLVPGEGEILGQVREAHEAGVAGPLLGRLFRQALHVGGRVRSETALGASPASVPAAAAALAQQVFGELAGRRVLLIGAGAAGENAARNLVSRGATVAAVANRSPERARALAEQLGAEALPLDGVEAVLPRVDVVVASTSAPGVVLGRPEVERALRARRGEPLLLVDIAVPRDLDAAIHDLHGCYLYDIDDLETVVAETLAGRRAEAARAEELVAAEADRFAAWLASLDVVPAIASLRARAEEIRAAELERASARLRRLSDTDRSAVEAITAQIVNKLLHLPIVRMKQAAATPAGAVYADALQHLFGLDEDQRR